MGGEPIELPIVGSDQAAGKPQMHAFVAIEPARLPAVEADPEMAAGRTERGKINRPARTLKGVADQEIEHGAGEIPGVAGIHRGKIPVPRPAVHGLGQFADQ